MDALPKPVTTLSHSSSIENSLEQYLPSFRPHLFFALTVLSVLLVPTMGRAEINTDKVMWIAENGIGVGRYQNVHYIDNNNNLCSSSAVYISIPSFISFLVHCTACFCFCFCFRFFLSSYCTRPPPIPQSPQASSTHGNFMPPDYLGHRRYIPWSRVGPTRKESKKQKKKEKEKSSSLTIEQRNQPHQRELQQRQPPSSSQHQPRKFR